MMNKTVVIVTIGFFISNICVASGHHFSLTSVRLTPEVGKIRLSVEGERIVPERELKYVPDGERKIQPDGSTKEVRSASCILKPTETEKALLALEVLRGAKTSNVVTRFGRAAVVQWSAYADSVEVVSVDIRVSESECLFNELVSQESFSDRLIDIPWLPPRRRDQ